MVAREHALLDRHQKAQKDRQDVYYRQCQMFEEKLALLRAFLDKQTNAMAAAWGSSTAIIGGGSASV